MKSPEGHQDPSVVISSLSFSYPGIDGRPVPGIPPVVQNMTASLLPGTRCLLLGANGAGEAFALSRSWYAGKTTLLKVLAGQHMVSREAVQILGHSPFHHTQLTSCGDLVYLGGNWTRDIAFAGYSIPLQGDFPASRMIDGVQGIASERKAQLMKVLDVDPNWRMHRVSDGQRRRVQLMLGLMKPFKVLLLDEITVDLDVLGRADLLSFLRKECDQRRATIIYATHIFDGLESWPTHLMYIASGRLQVFAPVADVPEMHQAGLLRLVEGWLREEKRKRKLEKRSCKAAGSPALELPQWSNGYTSGRATSSLRDSSNAVMRM